MQEDKKNRRRLTGEELDGVRENLIARKKTLWNEVLHELTHEAGEINREAVDTIRESGDRALGELMESSLLHLVEMKARELEAIEAALNRVDSGEYGRCVDCGQWIRPARLEVQPFAVRCIKCQEARERIENV